VNSCGTACRVVLATVLTRSFRLRAMAAQRFLFVGVRCVETLSRVVLGAGGLLFGRGAAEDGVATTHSDVKAAKK
jgi:hypothetical protein